MGYKELEFFLKILFLCKIREGLIFYPKCILDTSLLMNWVKFSCTMTLSISIYLSFKLMAWWRYSFFSFNDATLFYNSFIFSMFLPISLVNSRTSYCFWISSSNGSSSFPEASCLYFASVSLNVLLWVIFRGIKS